MATEIENRNFLEKMLRQCIDDVRAEITKKKAEFKSSHCKFLSIIRVNIFVSRYKQRKEVNEKWFIWPRTQSN